MQRGPAARRASLPALSDASRGKRLLFLVAGPRGEVQPLVALSAGCKKAGFDVLAVTQSCHQGFFEDFGVAVVDCDVVSELDVPMAPALSMSLPAGTDGPSELSPATLRTMWEFTADFKPDLIVTARPCSAGGHAFARSLGIPLMEVQLQMLLPTATARSPCGEWPGCFGPVRYWMWIRFRRDSFRPLQSAQLPVLRGMLKGASGGDIGVWSGFEAHMLDTVQPVVPGLIAISPFVVSLPRDRPAEYARSEPLGYVTVSRQEQLTKADDYFGCRSFLRAFVENQPEEPPVYIGFGPCTDGGPVALTALATGAAMEANVRAAVLCGAAGLGWAALAGTPKKLQDYAEARIVFVGSAPHEMLFPRCSVVVHHGGIGTAACAMRSGVPQILLPTSPEQRLQTDTVIRLGVGVDLGPLADCSPEMLGQALRRVVADDAMAKRCKELGEKLQKEEGLKASIEHIDRFFKEQLATGTWASLESRRRRELEVLRSTAPGGCFAWFCRVVFGCGRMDFRPRLRKIAGEAESFTSTSAKAA